MKNAILLAVVLTSTVLGTLMLIGCSSGASEENYKPPAPTASSTQGKASNQKAAEAK